MTATDTNIHDRMSCIMFLCYMNRLPIWKTANDKEIITNLSGNIELSHVSFRYSDEMPYVIDDLSLIINKGEYLGVVGTTGCEKSSVFLCD